MRGFLRIMCLVLGAIVPVVQLVCALAYENEPYDFRGIKWGSRIDEISDMLLDLDGGDFKAYTRKHDKMMIGDAKLNSLHYISYKDRFYCVRIEFTGPSNFNKIRNEFLRIYGEPGGRQHYDRHFYWGGENASITLDYDESTGSGEIGYKYMPVDFLIDEDQKNQAIKDTGGSAGEPTSDGEQTDRHRQGNKGQ